MKELQKNSNRDPQSGQMFVRGLESSRHRIIQATFTYSRAFTKMDISF